MMNRNRLMSWSLLLLLVAGGASAQPSSLETRLRDQLRETRSQLEDLQSQQVKWQADKAALEHERDEALKKAQPSKTVESPLDDRSRAQARADQTALRDAHRAREELEARLRAADTQHARADDQIKAERDRATADLAHAQEQIQRCTAKNTRLYEVGISVVDAYAHLGVGGVLAARQPFAAKARVRLDEAAQAYGDQLYEQKFDPRSASAPAGAIAK
jgi:hypothetical protein